MVSIATTTGSSPSATTLSRAADRYEFKALLVHGRTGSVYHATDRMSGRSALIQLLPYDLRSSDARKQFDTRARALVKVEHRNLASVLDYGYHYGLAYLVFDHAEATSLEELLAQRGPMSWREFAVIFDALLEGLKAVHEHGLVHGDLQPSHIMLTTQGRLVTNVVLTGFGFPDLANGDVGLADDTRHMSTVDAIAPERILRQKCDHRLDLYSLGATAYEMLTGEPPFQPTSMDGVFRSIYEPPTPLGELILPEQGVPKRALEFIGQLLEKAPDDRPSDPQKASAQFRDIANLPSYSIKSAKIEAPKDREKAARDRADDIAAARPTSGATSASGPSRKRPRLSGAHQSSATIQIPVPRLAPRPTPGPDAQGLSPRLVFQVTGLLALFVAFVVVGWLVVMAVYRPAPPSTPAPAPPIVAVEAEPISAPVGRDAVQPLFAQIDRALNEQRYGTAESLLERLEERDDFPAELNGTLKAYRSRLDLSSKLDKAHRLEASGRLAEALVLYSEVAERYPNHTAVPKSIERLKNSFMLEVTANVRAIVSVDGEPVGVTPFSGMVPLGTSRVAVSRQGYKTWETSVAAQGGATLSLETKLVKRRRNERPDRLELNLDASPFMDLMEMK